MKVLLGENVAQYNQALAAYNQRLAVLQSALDAYTALGIATVPTVAELAELQDAPAAFLVKMLTNRQALTLAGVPVSVEKSYDMMEKPAGSVEFVRMVTDLFSFSHGISKRVDVADCELVNGQVQLKQSVKDAKREQSRFYATTQAQLDEWTQVQAIVTALNTLRVMPRFGNTFSAPQYLEKVLERQGYAAGGNAFEVNPQAVLSN